MSELFRIPTGSNSNRFELVGSVTREDVDKHRSKADELIHKLHDSLRLPPAELLQILKDTVTATEALAYLAGELEYQKRRKS